MNPTWGGKVASFGYVLVYYFTVVVLLYFSVSISVGSTDGASVPVYQSSLLLSMKLFKVEFGPDNIALEMWIT